MNLTTRQLRIFVLLAETLSFQRTAEMLHVTQPTLSKLLKETEETLGVKLFERTTRMVRLSREGQDILEIARKITALHEKGMLELDHRLRDRNNRVAVAALPTLAASLIPLLIQSLARKHPRVRVEVYDPIANEALQLLRERRVDIAVTTMNEEGAADLVYQELFTEPFVLFHSVQIKPDVTRWMPTELARLPLISMPPGTSVRVLTERAFQAASQPFNPLYSLRDLNTIARFVQHNCGIALLPESSLDNATQRGVRKTRLRQALSRSVGMYVRRESEPSELLRHTLDELRRLGRDRQLRSD
ncbi:MULTISPECIES: LysR family transcriptional regulator [Achromobacter]|uniref:LysR family transcriptional regulator n=1 Tax=Alcaligenes xylosoxydans xylosoxydans TaxID=85698 RepID=A0A424W9Y4_ALCXX|nr:MULTISPECIES: LysR family transcriptional regulator [Achromobacter]MBC9905534.1 LysR family transcriptional regulator [Achromobacter xylosoxidans]MBD0871082.1 LysR family transcriptional regulator [Achromobacter xylosoxidans]MDH1300674.1 LysR family transcriptional regulator [Achromobacter sp. GD03932]QNP86325.1 LysR family transcriptional regulator [Achromobacter xylosoxidans]RPJ89978.1 LysR family transcriptional regulator [Achromobacter xylosoxidans]